MFLRLSSALQFCLRVGSQPLRADCNQLSLCALPALLLDDELRSELSTLADTLVDLTGAPTESTGQASLVPLAFGRRPTPFARTSSRGMPVLVSAQQAWFAGDGQAPTEEWEAAAAAVIDALP